jgi:hypothetical protein
MPHVKPFDTRMKFRRGFLVCGKWQIKPDFDMPGEIREVGIRDQKKI